MGRVTKVVKLYLISEQKDKNGNEIDYEQINKIIWDLQKQEREIKNKTTQLCWEWSKFSSDYNNINGEYPKEEDVLNYTLSGFIYDKLKSGYDLYSANISSAIRECCAAFNNTKKDIYRGTKSIPSYKSYQPIELHKNAILLVYDDKKYRITLKLLNRDGAKKYGINGCSIQFHAIVKDNSTRTILERLIDGIYSISGSKLIYDREKKMWRINLSYSFDVERIKNLDSEKILGVDIGVVYPICASVYGSLNRFKIKGGEIENFSKQVVRRKRSLQSQGKYCGDGRIGHGREKRNKPVYEISNKIARFRDTANHKYSRALVDFALKNNCGIIQMEDLSGITSKADKFMKDWSYYDLQMKIENKAKEYGIKTKYIEPKYTSQRCSKCGFIDKENRPKQAIFECKRCGFKENADYNASQNIAIKDIDLLIDNQLSCET